MSMSLFNRQIRTKHERFAECNLCSHGHETLSFLLSNLLEVPKTIMLLITELLAKI
jgi:hypothetical protein